MHFALYEFQSIYMSDGKLIMSQYIFQSLIWVQTVCKGHQQITLAMAKT